MYRTNLKKLIASITPHDPLERRHIARTIKWIESGAPLYRVLKPATPPQHLISYFVLFDKNHNSILLVDHINARLWLPSGGHIETNEDPSKTVIREAAEEFKIKAQFLFKDPIFLTVTKTVGKTAGHTDVSLWYVIKGNSFENLWFDSRECNSIRWFSVDKIPLEKSDPHMGRFIQKLKTYLKK